MNCIYDKVGCRLRRIPESLSHCNNCVLFQILEELKVLRATS